MIKDGVIVETYVLIAFIRGTEIIAHKDSALLHENRLVTTGLIIAELLQGMKDAKEERNISDILADTSPLEIATGLWIKAGKAALSLQKNGINLPLSDVVTAVLATEHNLSVFTLDNHFEQIPGVKLFKG